MNQYYNRRSGRRQVNAVMGSPGYAHKKRGAHKSRNEIKTPLTADSYAEIIKAVRKCLLTGAKFSTHFQRLVFSQSG